MDIARSLLTPALALTLALVPACEDDADLPPTEQGEDAESDPEAPEDDPSAPSDPPSNWSTLSTDDAPTALHVYANGSETNAGTGASLKLTYRNGAGTYSCTVAGVSSGQTASCTPSKTSTTTNKDVDLFWIAFATSSNTDGLRFSTVAATINGTKQSLEEFSVDATNGDFFEVECTGCSYVPVSDYYYDCGSCYLDGNNHTSCVNAKIEMSKGANSTFCVDYD